MIALRRTRPIQGCRADYDNDDDDSPNKDIYIYTGCPRRNVPDFGRVFLMLKYTVITQNTYVQS
jgi:hypothetical protein